MLYADVHICCDAVHPTGIPTAKEAAMLVFEAQSLQAYPTLVKSVKAADHHAASICTKGLGSRARGTARNRV